MQIGEVECLNIFINMFPFVSYSLPVLRDNTTRGQSVPPRHVRPATFSKPLPIQHRWASQELLGLQQKAAWKGVFRVLPCPGTSQSHPLQICSQVQHMGDPGFHPKCDTHLHTNYKDNSVSTQKHMKRKHTIFTDLYSQELEWQRTGHLTQMDRTRHSFSTAVPATSICIAGGNCSPRQALFLTNPPPPGSQENKI